VSHPDELDEFEAGLQVALKKEYSAVFRLVRYCVLTQNATYLCNRLDLHYVPQPSNPFFHLKMENVWVWDKNRIPCKWAGRARTRWAREAARRLGEEVLSAFARVMAPEVCRLVRQSGTHGRYVVRSPDPQATPKLP
jgi:uncharacterized protein DUF2469